MEEKTVYYVESFHKESGEFLADSDWNELKDAQDRRDELHKRGERVRLIGEVTVRSIISKDGSGCTCGADDEPPDRALPHKTWCPVADPPPQEPITLGEIRGVCNRVQAVAGKEIQYALSGGASMIWLGGEKVTYDVDFIADGPLPIEPEETYENGYRYSILGRRVDWTVQTDHRKDLFMTLLSHGVYHEGVVVIPIECLLVLKCTAWTSRQKHVADVYLIRKTMDVDIETAIRLADELGVNPAHLKVSLETAARFSLDQLIEQGDTPVTD